MKKIGLSIFAILGALIVLTTAVFAWFVGSGAPSDSFLQYSGELNFNVGFFRGIDNNRDGRLDAAYNSLGSMVYEKNFTDPISGITYPKSPREEITTYMYEEIDKLSGASYEEYISGTSIILKLIIENPKSSDSDAKISVCFSNLSDYFFGSKNLDEEELLQILKRYTARIMFKIEDIVIRTYKSDGIDGGIDYGYPNLSGSSVNTEYGGEIRQIEELNTYGKDSFYLWEVSENQKFVENVILNKGELMEIDFYLACMQNEEIYQNYTAYWQNYILNNPLLSSEDIEFINYMSRKELAYLVSDDSENLELNFSIDKMIIYGEQLNDE
ncbi:hypothetical protein EOM82_01340 [bacterium]|nr:hypothetical protein [bacterium]